MLVYIITIIVSVFFAFLAQEIKKKQVKRRKDRALYCIFCILSFLMPFLVAAFRNYNIGTDTGGTYQDIYYIVLHGVGNIRDVGYALINKIGIYLLNSYTGVLFLTSLLMYSCFYKGIFNQSKYPATSTYLFFATNVYFISMNMIRQSIATSIFIISIPYIEKKSFIKFGVLNIIAALIHSSSIIYLITYFLLNKQLKIKTVAITSVLSYVFGGLLSSTIIDILCRFSYFRKYFAWYISSSLNTGTLNLFSLLISLSILIFLILINKKAKENKDYNILLWLTFLSFISLMLSPFIPLMQRISWLFSFPTFIYLPKMFDFIENKNMRLLTKFGVIGGYTCYMIATTFILGYNEVVPYKSIFD